MRQGRTVGQPRSALVADSSESVEEGDVVTAELVGDESGVLIGGPDDRASVGASPADDPVGGRFSSSSSSSKADNNAATEIVWPSTGR